MKWIKNNTGQKSCKHYVEIECSFILYNVCYFQCWLEYPEIEKFFRNKLTAKIEQTQHCVFNIDGK